jgi:hypothetical protein
MEISKMKMILPVKQFAFAAVAAVCLLAADAVAQSTSPRPLQRATDEHLALLMSRAYEKLDHAADEARAKQLALSDGQPLLTAIYAGVAGCGCGNQLTDELWQVRKQRIDEWKKLKPNSITARLVSAAFPIRYAWMARGGGYAGTVSPEGWKLFRERMEEGRKSLEALDAKTRQDAGWYEMMLDVALSQGWPRAKFDALFAEAVEKYPYYTPFYFARMSFYSQRWYGSDEEAKRVAEDAVVRTRDRWGEILYTRLNWAMMDYQMFTSGRTDWPRMKSGFEQLIAQYPDAWNVNNFGKFACLALDLKTLSVLLPKIGDTPIVQAWENDLNFYYRCRAAAAKAG